MSLPSLLVALRSPTGTFDPGDIRLATCPNRNEKFFAHWTKSTHCRGLPTGVFLNQTAIARIVRRPRERLPVWGLSFAMEEPRSELRTAQLLAGSESRRLTWMIE